MHITKPVRLAARRHKRVLLSGVLACVLLRGVAAAQGLTGMLIGTVSDVQGAAIPGAVVRLGSPAMIEGSTTLTTNEQRATALPVSYSRTVDDLDISMPGFAPFHETNILIGAGATIEKTVILELAGVAVSVVVQGAGSGSPT